MANDRDNPLPGITPDQIKPDRWYFGARCHQCGLPILMIEDPAQGSGDETMKLADGAWIQCPQCNEACYALEYGRHRTPRHQPADALLLAVRSNEIASQRPVRITPMTGNIDVVGSPWVLINTPWAQQLLEQARSLAAKGDHQIAVVFAHAACELHTEGALVKLLLPRKDKTLAELVAPKSWEIKSLWNPKVRRVYTKLTLDKPKTAPWWKQWKKSRRDRNAVAHNGKPMTQAESQSALDAADKYFKHVTEKVEAALKNPPP